MTTYIYQGQSVEARNGWVTLNNTRIKLDKALAMEGFERVTSVPRTVLAQDSAQDIQDKFIRAVRAEVARRIGLAASAATQLNIAAAAAGGVLSETQMSEYLAGLNWINEMRDTGKQLILDGDTDYAFDEKWPSLPESVQHLLEGF